MSDTTKIPLVSSEIASIWNCYIGESISAGLYKYFSNRVDDNEIRTLLRKFLDASNQRVDILSKIFNQENLPVPDGFTDDDININAPRLFSDDLYLQYLVYISGVSMRYYSLFLSQVVRSDIRDFFSKLVSESLEMFNSSCQVSLSKGLLSRTPRVEVPKEVQYIKSETFILDLFGKKRPMTVDEITACFSNVNTNIVRKAILIGYNQVCKDKKVSDCLIKLIDSITDENNSFSSLLDDEGISVGGSSEAYVTDSTISPFSDKFIMYKTMSMYRIRIASLGVIVGDIERVDILNTVLKHLTGLTKDSKEILDVMIYHGWLQQPPQAINHENLVGV